MPFISADYEVEQTFSIPCPGFNVKLSHWDRTFVPYHTKRILFFQLDVDEDRAKITKQLHAAFHNTVQKLPFLAGSIVPFTAEEGGRPWLRNLIPKGAAHLVVKDLSADLSYTKLEAANFSQSLLDTDKLCPLPQVAYVQEEPVDVCRFQANFVEGGLLLVASVIHIVCDGNGVTQTIRIFADFFRQATRDIQLQPPRGQDDVYTSDRTKIVNGGGAVGCIDLHPAWTSSTINTHSQLSDVQTSCKTYRIDVGMLDALKQAASKLTPKGEWISTNDAISGLIWRSIVLARRRAGILKDQNKEAYITQPVDCRSLIKLSQPYFGNALYMAQATLDVDVLADEETGISAAAQCIRASLAGVTGDKFRDLVGYVERTSQDSQTRLKVVEFLNTSGIILTSHFKFPMHEIDFGSALGRLKALRLPAKGMMTGAVMVMPKLPDGSCEFLITEADVTVASLGQDAVFAGFTHEV
ncbi:hypothetical protein LMH87_002010 [Akanthomyces muscarius]|uniref:Trichothecene 3-O-acetyltransferase n=1 Tax=Akanthomyces muscarius TaxID=2231603 RepID=A0A9W8Q5G8_AKAMU|nr:hypothetical protein LMH87_002010 [Akanthomyces muscarius]KAJ4147497.1 hypothetical protein LMH87_002010 [Akanthomyces muscarius]